MREQEQADLPGISVLPGLRQNRKAGRSRRDNITIKILDTIRKRKERRELTQQEKESA